MDEWDDVQSAWAHAQECEQREVETRRAGTFERLRKDREMYDREIENFWNRLRKQVCRYT